MSTITLTDQDKSTIRIAAYGAVSLLSATGSAHKASTAGCIALNSATGQVGYVLAAKSRDIKLTGKSVAELADRVLPALTASVRLLQQQDPGEAANFRTTVLVAIDAATQAGKSPIGPATTEMVHKITAALDAA
ncbi:hypothetical protein [Nocardia sp. IFM 10818]